MTTCAHDSNATHPINDPFLRKPEARRFLGNPSASTFDRWVKRGRIQRIKLSERISVYRLSDLQAFVEQATAASVTVDAAGRRVKETTEVIEGVIPPSLQIGDSTKPSRGEIKGCDKTARRQNKTRAGNADV